MSSSRARSIFVYLCFPTECPFVSGSVQQAISRRDRALQYILTFYKPITSFVPSTARLNPSGSVKSMTWIQPDETLGRPPTGLSRPRQSRVGRGGRQESRLHPHARVRIATCQKPRLFPSSSPSCWPPARRGPLREPPVARRRAPPHQASMLRISPCRRGVGGSAAPHPLRSGGAVVEAHRARRGDGGGDGGSTRARYIAAQSGLRGRGPAGRRHHVLADGGVRKSR